MQKIACVIMASGKGKRFGSNKLLADFNGEYLIMRIFKASDIEKLERLVVTRTKELAALAEDLGIKAIMHDMPCKSDTIKIAVANLKECTHIMFCAADQALLRRESLELLIKESANNPDKIIRAGSKASPGLPVIFPSSFFGELLSLSGEEGGKTVSERHPDDVIFCDIPESELMDADTPAELEALQKINNNQK